MGLRCLCRGEGRPLASAIAHALSSLGLAWRCSSPSAARAASRPCPSQSTRRKMRSTTSLQDGPARSAQRRMRPAPQSEHDLPSGRSPAWVEWRFLANDGKSGRVASRSPARKTPAVASVALRSTVLPTARWLTEW